MFFYIAEMSSPPKTSNSRTPRSSSKPLMFPKNSPPPGSTKPRRKVSGKMSNGPKANKNPGLRLGTPAASC